MIATRESIQKWSTQSPQTSLSLEIVAGILAVGVGFVATDLVAGVSLPKLGEADAQADAPAATASTFGLTAADFGVNWSSEQRKQDAQAMAKRCLSNGLEMAQQIEREHGIPALLLLAKHAREASCDFTKNALNGQPLNQVTTLVPKNYGPFPDWPSSVEAGIERGYYKNADWTKPEVWADVAERFNGLGYRYRSLISPYVWAGDRRYDSQGGKFTADGIFNRSHLDRQIGVIPLVVAMLEEMGGQPAATGGNTQAKILAQAIAANGRSSANGPEGGRLACAWAIFNFVVEPTLGRSLRPKMTNIAGVNALVSDLQRHAGLRKSNGPSKGAIVVHGLDAAPGGANQHIGVCADDQCSTSWNNSSSLAKWRLSNYPQGYTNISYWVFD